MRKRNSISRGMDKVTEIVCDFQSPSSELIEL